jgi:hypothetical protein
MVGRSYRIGLVPDVWSATQKLACPRAIRPERNHTFVPYFVLPEGTGPNLFCWAGC